MTTRVSAEVRSTFRDVGLRLGLATAALVLAGASRGDALVLFALVAALSTRPTAIAALAAAAVGASWRWGSSALVAWSSNQSVLGAAGFVGPTTAAAASWTAAAAVLLAAAHPAAGVLRREREPFAWLDGLQAAVAGVVAGLVVLGPAMGDDAQGRLGGALVGGGLAVGLCMVRARFRRLDAVAAVLAVVAGAASVGLAAAEAPAWSGTVTGGPIRDSAVLTVAVVAVVAVVRKGLADGRTSRWVPAGDRS
jgi:hypothetical protein